MKKVWKYSKDINNYDHDIRTEILKELVAIRCVIDLHRLITGTLVTCGAKLQVSYHRVEVIIYRLEVNWRYITNAYIRVVLIMSYLITDIQIRYTG